MGHGRRYLPYLRLGDGSPLVVSPGLSSEHANPTGIWRRTTLSWAAPFAEHFTVYLVQRKPGLARDATLSDVAADYAEAIERDLGRPVLSHGTSTGGSVALQIAIDHPQLVHRMVVAAAACRLAPHGRPVQEQLARLTESGDARGASALLWGAVARPMLSYPARGLGWLMGRSFKVDDPSDMLTMIAAEDSFDAEPELSRVQAPTLVLGGTADPFYSEDLFRRTADGIPRGRVVLFPGKGHIYAAGSKVPAAVALGFLLEPGFRD
ncbi:alpha/beta hydrolase [Nocardioides guangzhouensis]|uniref:Alpha/beta hydrolase n=1 Tax=Nocardioides guangzhouensis TaxID=2497878 RepID=A0A4Q4YYP2_9ACTN|nr:alpha/beta hydrolase [Nocardioides guangzhouensis]